MLDTRAQSGDGPSVRTDTHKREPTKATRAASVASLLFVVKMELWGGHARSGRGSAHLPAQACV